MIKKRVILVDDEPLILSLIKEMIDEEDGFEVSQTAATKEEFFKAIRQYSFDVAIVDFSIGARDEGIDILKLLKNEKIPLPVIILSAHSEIDFSFKCLDAGAKGYINKSCIISSLIQGLKEVCRDRLFVSGNNGEYIINEYQKHNINPTDPVS